MKRLLVALLGLTAFLSGCGSGDVDAAAQNLEALTLEDLPAVDEVYLGHYDAWVNLMPPVEDPGPPVYFTLGEASDLTITEAWFVADDGAVFEAGIDTSRGIPFVLDAYQDGVHPYRSMQRVDGGPDSGDGLSIDVVFRATHPDGSVEVFRAEAPLFSIEE